MSRGTQRGGAEALILRGLIHDAAVVEAGVQSNATRQHHATRLPRVQGRTRILPGDLATVRAPQQTRTASATASRTGTVSNAWADARSLTTLPRTGIGRRDRRDPDDDGIRLGCRNGWGDQFSAKLNRFRWNVDTRWCGRRSAPRFAIRRRWGHLGLGTGADQHDVHRRHWFWQRYRLRGQIHQRKHPGMHHSHNRHHGGPTQSIRNGGRSLGIHGSPMTRPI